MSSPPSDAPWKAQVRIAENQDALQILSRLEPLLRGRGECGKKHWQLCVDGQGMRRSFRFKTFRNNWVRLGLWVFDDLS